MSDSKSLHHVLKVLVVQPIEGDDLCELVINFLDI